MVPYIFLLGSKRTYSGSGCTNASNGVSIVDKDSRQVVRICVDACTTGWGALCGKEAYHTTFPPYMLDQGTQFVSWKPSMLQWPSSYGHPVSLATRSGYTTTVEWRWLSYKTEKARTNTFRHVPQRYGCHALSMKSHPHARTHLGTVISAQQTLSACAIWEACTGIGYNGLLWQGFK